MIHDFDSPLQLLRSDGELTLYRAPRVGATSVLALAATERQPRAETVERLEHEHSLASELDAPWAVHPLELTQHDGRPILLLEDSGGQPLDRVLERRRGKPLELTWFLGLASELAGALAQMHKRGILHKDVKPANVLVDDEGHVRLMGFGLASRVRSERQPVRPPELIAGTFAYMAPEQTGRMNRLIDARSDLYSLGVTLYELLTGVLPFTASDPMELIHCHIARQPAPPSERLTGVPRALDNVVLKLLAKNPEDRYRTANSLEADLRSCRSSWLEEGRIREPALGQQRVSDTLQLPRKLYGRQAASKVLSSAFERVESSGITELVLISGYSGIGKSSIVNELHKELVPARALFAAGKFDQYKRDIPYATLGQAFQSLVRQLLSKEDAQLARWQSEILAALGANGQLMVNLIPELSLVIGEQPPVPSINPQSAQGRFHLVCRSLLGVFAKPGHPLVLFIDDLQWLDTGTLQLLQHLVTEPEVRNLLLIGAYRDNEIGPGHALSSTISAIRKGGAVTSIALKPLQVSHLAQLCADMLHSDARRTRQLAELLSEKTGGNPFFALEFLAALAEDGLLSFDPVGERWRWDIARIRAKGITDNVAELMTDKLSRLPLSAREALAQLACLGNTADVHSLALLLDGSEERARATLGDAANAGFVLQGVGSFSFTHDRVQEAAYALIPPAERPAAHLRIARMLLSRTLPAGLEEKIFELVHQYDRGASELESQTERDAVAELYLIAGKRAKTASAHASAQAYFSTGRALLAERAWERQYRLTFELELHRAECEIVVGDMAAAEERLAQLSKHASSLEERASVVCLAVLLCFSTGRNERAVEVALAFLSRVGIAWSQRPTEAEVRQEYLEMRRKLAGRSTAELLELRAMSEPACIATMAVLTELFPAAYAVDRYLLELVLLRMTNLSLEHGHCESSSVAYSALNMALGASFADYRAAFSLGELACELVERRGADRYKARVYSCFAAFTMPWMKPLSLCRPLMTQAFEISSSMGDMAFAAYNCRNLISHLMISGMPLAQVQREAEQVKAFASKVQLGLPVERFIRQLEVIQKLRGVSLGNLPTDEAWAKEDVTQQPQLAMMVCYHWVFRLQERFFAADFPAALAAAAYVEGIRWAMRSSIEEAEYDFYAALTCAAAVERASPEQRESYLRRLAKHYARICVWADNCWENFANRKALVGAEIARLEGKIIEALQRYEEAAELARQHGFLQNEGLANELAGQLYASQGLQTAAFVHLQNARDCYERWGALSKVKQLDARYPQLRTRSTGVRVARPERSAAQLDVETVDKASRTLSSEMALPSLLEKLMRLAVEHAGAERGLLILLREGEPHVEADATIAHGSVEVSVRRARLTPSDAPQGVLQYVLRTHERVVLDDASVEGLDDDEYVRHNRPKSVLCLPIFKQTSVVGALYLENNLTSCAFTADRVAVLDFLASQAAISLENARLYSDLQRSEALLKEAQHLSSTGSFYWRVALDTLEFSEQTCRIYDLDPAQPVTLAGVAARTHPEDLRLLQELIGVARGPATDLDYLYRVQMPDFSVKHLHLVAHGALDKNGQLEYIGAIQDITQRHLAEEALGKVRSELAHVTRFTSLGALSASIAHEVSQPLAGIVTNSSTCLRMLAADPPNLERARETVRRTLRDGQRAADVIARLRALFGNKGPSNEPVDLNETAREVIALSWNELQRGRVIIRSELASDLPPVAGDRVQLQQVILNLLLNAADAMSGVDHRSRVLVIKTEREADDHVRLSVQDVGVGFYAADVDRLFEAFYSTKADGMGMGLSVSRSIVESHHGRLWAEANTGPGATFSFRLPSAASQDFASRLGLVRTNDPS